MELIKETNPYDWRNTLDQDDEKKIRELLMGKSVAKVADDHLLLSDGTLVKVVPNQGGCACSSGDYELTHLEGTPNVITNVEVVKERAPEDGITWYPEDYIYSVFVLCFEERINLFTVEGSDGNGYYGTGYTLFVKRPKG